MSGRRQEFGNSHGNNKWGQKMNNYTQPQGLLDDSYTIDQFRKDLKTVDPQRLERVMNPAEVQRLRNEFRRDPPGREQNPDPIAHADTSASVSARLFSQLSVHFERVLISACVDPNMKILNIYNSLNSDYSGEQISSEPIDKFTLLESMITTPGIKQLTMGEAANILNIDLTEPAIEPYLRDLFMGTIPKGIENISVLEAIERKIHAGRTLHREEAALKMAQRRTPAQVFMLRKAQRVADYQTYSTAQLVKIMNMADTTEDQELPMDPTTGDPQRFVYKKKKNWPGAGTFHFYALTHTFGNTVREQLLDNPHVAFAGYRKPHPLVTELELIVQVTHQKNYSVPHAVAEALGYLMERCDDLHDHYLSRIDNYDDRTMDEWSEFENDIPEQVVENRTLASGRVHYSLYAAKLYNVEQLFNGMPMAPTYLTHPARAHTLTIYGEEDDYRAM